MQESMIDYTQHWGSEGAQYFNEALEDSKCLQTLTASLLETLQYKQDEIQLQCDPAPDDDLSSEKELSRRSLENNIENLIRSLQNIQKDVEANIESFNNPPTKTFFQSNIEQLTAIYQLLFILPSLRPFIPDKSPNASIFEEQPPAASIGVKLEDEESKDMKEAACFNREPRSLLSLPPSRHTKGELGTAGSLGIRY
ncbi:hypothetical protein OEA41_009651 [Lepraria neglecta]|uniref:Uncharacterized protein n=1 Tax=Lepraria neglecta TaxID=209136 RepID=A0AAD9Z238_9LECA|nr:hypothetical protein OEA41_009651 [Lepraria neglecta]